MVDNNSEMMKKIMNATEAEGRVASFFFTELDFITNQLMRKFVKEVFLKHTPERFWKAPASTSGKYHNIDECAEYGLIKHVKRATRMSIQIMKGLGWFGHLSDKIKEEHEYNYNVVICAVLLHDILTAGFEGREKKKPDGTIGTDNLHPYYVREELRFKDFEGKHMYQLPFFDDVMKAIEGHYGFWSVIPNTANLKDAQSPIFIVYLSDYLASRKVEDWFKV